MQEGSWSIHVSKFFYLILTHSDTFSMYMVYNLTCNSVQVATHKVLYSCIFNEAPDNSWPANCFITLHC